MPATVSSDSGQPERLRIVAQAADLLGTTERSPRRVDVLATLPVVTESRGDRIRRIVDEAPPLSSEQCDRLARLMRPSSWAEPATALREERRAS
jgi:hypothetical protein